MGVVVWRGSLEESWVLRISLEVAMVWRASLEMVVVRCTALEEAVVQRASRRWLWFGKGCTKWVDTMVILTENALETEMGPGRRRQIKRNQQGPSRRRKRRRRKRSRTHHMLGYLFLHGCQDAHEGTHAFGR